MSTFHFDAVVIGAGPGGYPCAIRLAQLGKKVAIIEEKNLGGVCLNVGCIPSKALISAMRRYHDVKTVQQYGIEVGGEVRLNMAATQQWKSSVVNKLVSGIKHLLTGNKVEVFYGHAKLKDSKTIEVTSSDKPGTTTIEAKNIVIATGSKPIDLPAFKIDGQYILGSTEVLALNHVPKRTVVLGGGYIGLELGSALSLAGSQVCVVEMMPQLLTGFDPECTSVVHRQLKSQGIEFRLSTQAQSVVVEKKQHYLQVSSTQGTDKIPFDALVVTVGRKPRGQELELERFGVVVDNKGFIQVDHQLRTAHPHIFAIGDVCSQPMLAHKATRDAEVCAEVIAGHTHASIQNKVIPAVVFCEPELASVGMTLEEAKQSGRHALSAKFPFAALGRALASGESQGFAKIVYDAQSKLVLGVHLVGPHVTDLISEAALQIEMGATLEDISLTVHPHPTLGEIMMEVSKVGLGEAVHVLPNTGVQK